VWRMQGDGRGLSASVSIPRPVLVLMHSVSARPLRRLRSPSSTLPPGPDPAIAQLEARMRWMERRIKQLEDMMDVPPGWTNPPSPSGETGALDPPPAASSDGPLAGASRDAAKYRLTYDESGNVSDSLLHHCSPQPQVVYHGMTGWSHGPEAVVETRLPSPEDPMGMTNSSFAPIFQGLAISKHIFVAPELGDALLNAYFCYQVFNIIQRSTFLRDMALGGPLFSKFLLMAMYASATRMIDGMDDEQRRTQGELFIRLAKQYLAEDMEGPATLTQIQGLLLLSGRECAMGNVGQGWIHAGLVRSRE
jgi:hypothetical protein